MPSSTISVDESELFDSIVDLRRPGIEATALDQIEPQVKSAYIRYSASSHPASLTPISGNAQTPDALYDNYDWFKRADFDDTRSSLLRKTRRCVLCAINRPSDLDHFLPRRKYPEFSVFTGNLLPCCARCNRKKGTAVVDKDGRPMFAFPPLGEVAELPLTVTLEFGETLYLIFDINVLDASADVYSNHVKRLELRELFADEGLLELAGLKASLVECYATGGQNEVESQLRSLCNSLQLAGHPAYCRKVLLLAAAESVEFCNGGFQLIPDLLD